MSLEYAKKNYLSSNYSITTFEKEIGDLIGDYKTKSHGVMKYVFPSLIKLRMHLYESNKEYYRHINNLGDNIEPDFTVADEDEPESTPIFSSICKL